MGISRVGPSSRILTLGGLGDVAIRTAGAVAAAANWWDPNGDGLSVWAAYKPKSAASLAASYTDLSGNGNDAGVGVAPDWDGTNGWKFNGSTHYLTTTFTPASDQSQTMLVQYTNVVTATRCLVGMQKAADDKMELYPYLSGTTIRFSNGAAVDVIDTLLAGNLGVAGNQGYKNGSALGGAIAGYGAAPSLAVWIGCTNFQGSALLLADAYIQAFVLYDATLTSGQVSAVATAMAAL